jgi:hypothetical protein
MRIERIYVNTYRKDFHLARICVASIRYWYPEIPIYLLKDTVGAGDFDTSAIERHFGVRILQAKTKTYGWGFSKFEPLSRPSGEAFLFLDADTVMSGPILDRLAGIEADIIVDQEVQPIEKLRALYFDPEALRCLDPGFTYPGFTFNGGQFAALSGILMEADLNPFFDWGPPPKTLYPGVFKNGDQGLFNYIMQKKSAEGAISLVRSPIMIWPEGGTADHVDLDAIRNRRPVEDRVIHWAGMKAVPYAKLPRKDILEFFKAEYHSQVGRRQRFIDFLMDTGGTIRDFREKVTRRLFKNVRS